MYKHYFNLASVDLSNKFNHCIVIIYYDGTHLKGKPSLGYDTDFVYYTFNSQLENALACNLLTWKL